MALPEKSISGGRDLSTNRSQMVCNNRIDLTVRTDNSHWQTIDLYQCDRLAFEEIEVLIDPDDAATGIRIWRNPIRTRREQRTIAIVIEVTSKRLAELLSIPTE